MKSATQLITGIPAWTSASGKMRTYVLFLSLSITVFLGAFVVGGYKGYSGSDMDPHRSLFDLGFAFGPAIQALVEHHRLAYIEPEYGLLCWARRLPVIPVLGALSYHLSPQARVFYILKNLLFWPLWIYALFRLRSCYKIPDKWVLLAAGVMLLVPYNLATASRDYFEEGYLVPLIGLLFALLVTSRRTRTYFVIGVVIGLIYLTKSSMFLLCAAAACWCVITGWQKNRYATAVPAIFLGLAAAGWGGYVYIHTGRFAIGASSSSWNGENFYMGNNPYADRLYPQITLDELVAEHKLHIHEKMHDEWQLNDAEFALGWKFVDTHPGTVAKMTFKKLDVACCYLLEAPEAIPGHERPAVVASNLIDHLLMATMLAIAAYNLWRRKISSAEVLAILFVVTYMPAYIVAHLWARHMVPLYGLAALTLAIQLGRGQRGAEGHRAFEADI